MRRGEKKTKRKSEDGDNADLREAEDDTGQPQLCYSVTEGLQVQRAGRSLESPMERKCILLWHSCHGVVSS